MVLASKPVAVVHFESFLGRGYPVAEVSEQRGEEIADQGIEIEMNAAIGHARDRLPANIIVKRLFDESGLPRAA